MAHYVYCTCAYYMPVSYWFLIIDVYSSNYLSYPAIHLNGASFHKDDSAGAQSSFQTQNVSNAIRESMFGTEMSLVPKCLWYRNVSVPKCLGTEMSQYQNVSRTKMSTYQNVPGTKMSTYRNVSRTKMSTYRNVSGTEMSTYRNVAGTEMSLYRNVSLSTWYRDVPRTEMSGTEMSVPKCPWPKYLVQK